MPIVADWDALMLPCLLFLWWSVFAAISRRDAITPLMPRHAAIAAITLLMPYFRHYYAAPIHILLADYGWLMSFIGWLRHHYLRLASLVLRRLLISLFWFRHWLRRWSPLRCWWCCWWWLAMSRLNIIEMVSHHAIITDEYRLITTSVIIIADNGWLLMSLIRRHATIFLLQILLESLTTWFAADYLAAGFRWCTPLMLLIDYFDWLASPLFYWCHALIKCRRHDATPIFWCHFAYRHWLFVTMPRCFRWLLIIMPHL